VGNNHLIALFMLAELVAEMLRAAVLALMLGLELILVLWVADKAFS
jgi:hypothetical protein